MARVATSSNHAKFICFAIVCFTASWETRRTIVSVALCSHELLFLCSSMQMYWLFRSLDSGGPGFDSNSAVWFSSSEQLGFSTVCTHRADVRCPGFKHILGVCGPELNLRLEGLWFTYFVSCIRIMYKYICCSLSALIVVHICRRL